MIISETDRAIAALRRYVAGDHIDIAVDQIELVMAELDNRTAYLDKLLLNQKVVEERLEILQVKMEPSVTGEFEIHVDDMTGIVTVDSATYILREYAAGKNDGITCKEASVIAGELSRSYEEVKAVSQELESFKIKLADMVVITSKYRCIAIEMAAEAVILELGKHRSRSIATLARVLDT